MIYQGKFKAVSIIFGLAFLFRLGLFFYTFPSSGIWNDTHVYHNLAVNLVQGNGYSVKTEPPYEPHFYREPGYPLYLASVYWIYSFWGDLHLLDNIDTLDILSDAPETVLAQFIQLIISSLTCVLLYFLLKLVIQKNYAFWIALLFALYQPYAANALILYRETLQTFIVMAMSYAFAKFYFTEHVKWLVYFSILWAISNMILQATSLLFGITFILLFYKYRELKRPILYTLTTIGVMVLCISPWLWRSYQFYPNPRILLSLGCSQTHEIRNYSRTYRLIGKAGFLDNDEAYQKRRMPWGLPAKTQFDMSYTGYLQSLIEAEGLPPIPLKVKFIDHIRQFRTSWLESFWIPIKYKPHSPTTLYIWELNTTEAYRIGGLFFALAIPALIVGLSAFGGIAVFYKNMLPIMLFFTYYTPLLFILGNEPRRGLPLHPYLFVFGSLFLIFLYGYFVNKKSLFEIKKKIFNY